VALKLVVAEAIDFSLSPDSSAEEVS